MPSRSILPEIIPCIMYCKMKGFTLIELMVVLSVFMVVGVLILSTIFIVLRETIKTNTINNVRQNGSFALSQISKTIRNAKKFEGVSSDGSTFTSNCLITSVLAGTPTPTPAVYKAVKITTFNDESITFSCGSNTIASNSVSLINTRLIKMSLCNFTCFQNNVIDPPTIGINLFLEKINPTGSAILPEQTASLSPIPFQTSVTIRNYNK